jgi:flavin-dependent dehydrogenase
MPLIIGSGLSGMMVSDALAQDRVEHLLIGGPPNLLPRPGESLNLEGTIGLWELFADHAQHYFTKRLVVGYLDDYVLSCDFNVARQTKARWLFNLLGYTAPQGFLHLDRIGLDADLYAQVTASPYCTTVDARVTDISHDPRSDLLTTVTLSDGTVLSPSHVFDATNHGRLVAQAAGVGCAYLGRPQRVAFTHYHAAQKAADGAGRAAWEHSSNLLRLFTEPDGVDAIAWCIPIGDYVSIGVSVDAERPAPDDETLLELTARAYASHGLDYRRRFDRAAPIQTLKHRYFVHDRGWGSNWLLVGPACCQIWWMSGSGVGSGFAAAQIARRFLDDPEGVGRAYSNYVKMLTNTHEVFDWFATVPREAINAEEVARHAEGFILGNVKRLAKSSRSREGLVSSVAGDLLYFLADRRWIARNYCPVIRADRADQTRLVLAEAD